MPWIFPINLSFFWLDKERSLYLPLENIMLCNYSREPDNDAYRSRPTCKSYKFAK